MLFQNKIALITGSGRGIGKAIASPGIVDTAAPRHFSAARERDVVTESRKRI